jgi:hypothetical protein
MQTHVHTHYTADTLLKTFWGNEFEYFASGASGFMFAGMKYVCVIPANSKGFDAWMQAEFGATSDYAKYIKSGVLPPSFGGGVNALPSPTIWQLRRLQSYGVIVHFHKIWSGWSYFLESESFHMVRNESVNCFVFTVACDQLQQ